VPKLALQLLHVKLPVMVMTLAMDKNHDHHTQSLVWTDVEQETCCCLMMKKHCSSQYQALLGPGAKIPAAIYCLCLSLHFLLHWPLIKPGQAKGSAFYIHVCVAQRWS
jgi:hypothetical protein